MQAKIYLPVGSTLQGHPGYTLSNLFALDSARDERPAED